MKNILPSIAIVLLFIITQSCTKKGSIKIKLETINPDLSIGKVVGANVELNQVAGELISQKQTDNNGEVLFADLKENTYRIFIAHDYNNNGTVSASELTDFTVALKAGEQKEIPISK